MSDGNGERIEPRDQPPQGREHWRHFWRCLPDEGDELNYEILDEEHTRELIEELGKQAWILARQVAQPAPCPECGNWS